MEFMFLGTSSGTPTMQRNVTALVIKTTDSKSWSLVDCGEGTQHQLLRTPYSLVQLEAIYITHVHGDHCYGLPGLLASASMSGRTSPLKIIAPSGIKEFVSTAMEFTDAHMTYELQYFPSESLNRMKVSDNFAVSSVPLSHRVPCHAYVFEERRSRVNLDANKLRALGVPEGPLWGKLAKGEAVSWLNGETLLPEDYTIAPSKLRKVIVGGDNDSPDLLSTPAVSADVLIHEATYTEPVRQQVGPGPQHSSAASVAKFASAHHIPNLVLTHFSARYHRENRANRSSISEVEEEARSYYKNSLFLANDFDLFRLARSGELQMVSSR